jgi:para-nitrobenzyl esterase
MKYTNRFLLLALLTVGCARSSERLAGAGAGVASSALAGTKWTLVQFTGRRNDDVRVPAAVENYDITFGADGKVAVQADCDAGTGLWSTPERSVLKFSQLAIARGTCQPASMSYKFLRDVAHMNTYVVRNGRLHISLIADGGVYEFKPAS